MRSWPVVASIALLVLTLLLLLRGELEPTPRAGRTSEGAPEFVEEGAPRDIEEPSQPDEPPTERSPSPPPEPLPLPAGVLEVRVVTPEGTVLESVAVTAVQRDSRGQPTGPVRTATTDADGSACFPGLTPASYRVRLTHPDYAPLVSIAGVRGSRGTRVTYTLRSGARLEVSVVGPRGEPLAGQKVLLTQYEEEPRLVDTGVDGRACFEHVKTSHGCRLQICDEPSIEIGVQSKGGTKSVEYRLGALLTGQVIGPDGPLPGVIVQAARSGSYHRAESDADGRYHTRGLGPGEAVVSVRGVGEDNFQTPGHTVEILAGITEHDFHIGPGSITGVVRHAVTGERLPGTLVVLNELHRSSEPPKSASDMLFLWLGTRTTGRFAARGLSPGRYRLRFSGPGQNVFREKEIVVVLDAAHQQRDLDVALEPKRLGTLLLRLQRPDGTAAEGQFFMEKRGNMFTTLHPLQREDGLYEFRLDEGSHRIGINGRPEVVEVVIDANRTTERVVQLAD